ncbi:hypothetical protein ACF0H5_019180 [Mactra antiquata]
MAMFSESYIKQESTFVDDGMKSVAECIKRNAEVLGNREAIVFASYKGGREVVTWIDLWEKSAALAKSLVKLGIKRGDFVALNLRSCPQWIYAAFGTMISGACLASVSFTYEDGSDLVATMNKMKKCNVLVMDPGENGQNWNIVKSLLDKIEDNGAVRSSRMPYLKYLFGYEKEEAKYMEGVKNMEYLINDDTGKGVCLPNITENDLAVLFQTSGSTGVPKLVALTHRHILFSREVNSGPVTEILDPTNIPFNDRPFTWMGGFPWSIISGQKRVTTSGFEPVPEDRILGIADVCVREKCNLLVTLPPLLHAMLDRKDELPANWPIEILLTGGQPLTNAIAGAVGSVAPKLLCAYGGTEFFIISTGLIEDSNFREFWCGKLPGGVGLEVKVVDENEHIVPVNTKGEIYVRSDGVFLEYLNDPEKTAAVKTPDGWYKTDDIGLMNEEGEFFIFGRKSFLIISGGMNVAPEILEHALEQHPGVATAVVVPIPDKVYYQVPCACILREKGSDVTEEQLRAYCEGIHNDKVGLFTVLPKYYLFFNDLPETTTGKISRPTLIKTAEKMIENL